MAKTKAVDNSEESPSGLLSHIVNKIRAYFIPASGGDEVCSASFGTGFFGLIMLWHDGIIIAEMMQGKNMSDSVEKFTKNGIILIEKVAGD